MDIKEESVVNELITFESLIKQLEELQGKVESSYEVHALRGKIEGLKTAEHIVLELSRAESSTISPSQATEINRAITKYIGSIV